MAVRLVETIEGYRVLHVIFIEGDNGSHEPSLPISIGIGCLHVYSSVENRAIPCKENWPLIQFKES